ncbi:hypothetical protein ACF1BN_01870 [Streptomyces sp. NPDC014861]|uniref:hypothetical protein n=1 Tax=Streptomyces sp. NPDC014861 TaxID=3364923 RepID=UPI0036FC95D5
MSEITAVRAAVDAARNPLTERYLNAPVGRRGLWPAATDPGRLHLVEQGLEDRFLTRPVFLEAAEAEGLAADLSGIVDLLFALPDRLFDGDRAAFGRAVGLRPEQIRLALRPPVPHPGRIGRADLYHDGDGFRLLEFNLSSALGGTQTPELNRLLLDDPAFAAFAEAERLEFPDTVELLAQAVKAAAREAGRPDGHVRVALMDWSAGFDKTRADLSTFAELLSRHGVEAFACHTGQVEESGGRVLVEGRPVDVVYRFFTLGELTADAASTAVAERLLDTFARCGVALVSPLCTSMHGNKRALAMLWDERFLASCASAERALVERLVPWTHEVRPGRIRVRGEGADFLAYCARHRERLVLKPAHGLGGTGTVLGRAVTPGQWSDLLLGAAPGRYVVQELVSPRAEHFPARAPGDPTRWVLNWGAFLIGRRYAGGFIRGLPEHGADVISYDNKAHATGVFQSTRH